MDHCRIGRHQRLSLSARHGNVSYMHYEFRALQELGPHMLSFSSLLYMHFSVQITTQRASTVDIRNMRQQLRNFKAVSIGVFCQFILLPFLGYAVVEMFQLPPSVGITLIIVVSSPGGSYSNWWCRLVKRL